MQAVQASGQLLTSHRSWLSERTRCVRYGRQAVLRSNEHAVPANAGCLAHLCMHFNFSTESMTLYLSISVSKQCDSPPPGRAIKPCAGNVENSLAKASKLALNCRHIVLIFRRLRMLRSSAFLKVTFSLYNNKLKCNGEASFFPVPKTSTQTLYLLTVCTESVKRMRN